MQAVAGQDTGREQTGQTAQQPPPGARAVVLQPVLALLVTGWKRVAAEAP
jgi:hypothetical protein